MTKPACCDCVFYIKDPAKLNEGQCRCLPPQVVALHGTDPLRRPVINLKNMWPQVSANSSCGQFREKEDWADTSEDDYNREE